ncbi:MAG TPA: hypothetical protein VHI32_07650, partial [Burkholderiales bacterium]|nr:hypothetical protein [Burkholderiales bacterium]
QDLVDSAPGHHVAAKEELHVQRDHLLHNLRIRAQIEARVEGRRVALDQNLSRGYETPSTRSFIGGNHETFPSLGARPRSSKS